MCLPICLCILPLLSLLLELGSVPLNNEVVVGVTCVYSNVALLAERFRIQPADFFSQNRLKVQLSESPIASGRVSHSASVCNSGLICLPGPVGAC